MEMLINDPTFLRRLIRRRRATGADRFDEVWDGVYIVSPLADDEHQGMSFSLGHAFFGAIQSGPGGLVRCGVNISDREKGWKKNYRCPDVVVFLPTTSARNLRTHWVGGPDFAVEILSPYDRTRQKLDFYARVGTRELLLVDRKPWALELYRLGEGVLTLVGKSTPDDPQILASEVLPLTFRLAAADPRPRVEMVHSDGNQRWSA